MWGALRGGLASRDLESPTYTRALTCGSHFRNSRIQLGTVDRGTTTR